MGAVGVAGESHSLEMKAVIPAGSTTKKEFPLRLVFKLLWIPLHSSPKVFGTLFLGEWRP